MCMPLSGPTVSGQVQRRTWMACTCCTGAVQLTCYKAYAKIKISVSAASSVVVVRSQDRPVPPGGEDASEIIKAP